MTTPYIPIVVGVPDDRLVLQSGGKVTRTEWGMDTRTKVFKSLVITAEDLAKAQVGQLDPDYPGLECVNYDIGRGEVTCLVTLYYKGSCNIDILKDAFPMNDVNLQSSSVNDDGYNDGINGGDGTKQTSVSFQYYSPQTTWKSIERTRPDFPPNTDILSSSFTITPFNTNPPTPISDLNYQILEEVTHFHTEQAGRMSDVESTSAILLIAHDLPPPVSLSRNGRRIKNPWRVTPDGKFRHRVIIGKGGDKFAAIIAVERIKENISPKLKYLLKKHGR